MARLNETILGAGSGINEGKNAPLVDLTLNGQNGVAPVLQGYVGNAAYVRRNIIPVLLEAPRGFQFLTNPDVWVATLKSIVELHAQTIDGLNSTLTAEFTETPIGGSSEMQEDIANVTRARSVPSFTIPDKYGKSVQTFFEAWVRNLLMDEETKIPRIMELTETERPTDMLPDVTGMSMVFLEPDHTHTRVVNAWLCVNMMPKSAGENLGNRDLTTAHEAVVHTIEFTAITQVGINVDALAQRILDSMSVAGSNPNHRAAVIAEVSADVNAAENGFAQSVAEVTAP